MQINDIADFVNRYTSITVRRRVTVTLFYLLLIVKIFEASSFKYGVLGGTRGIKL
jgi:hypothetical protein